MSQEITVRAGDTEPLTLAISAANLTDLTDLDTAVLYARKRGAVTNHVDGGALTVPDENELELVFDPLNQKNGGGNAFDEPGTYDCYVLATWDDGDETRHPPSDVDDDERLTVVVTESFE